MGVVGVLGLGPRICPIVLRVGKRRVKRQKIIYLFGTEDKTWEKLTFSLSVIRDIEMLMTF